MTKHHFYKGKALDENLRSIYEVRGKLPDMTRLEHEYHRRTTRVLIALVLFFAVLTAASWLGFLLFGANGSKGSEVELAFSGPTVAVSGVPQKLTLSYKNRDRNPLAFGSLRLRLPQDIAIREVDPKPAQDGTYEWNFGTLPAKSSGEIHLTVIPYGRLDSNMEIHATFSYKPANFNAEFQTLSTHSFTIAAPPITIAIEGPADALPGQELAYKAQIQNETDETFEHVSATLLMPTSFSLVSTEPAGEKGIWNIGTLPKGEKKEFIFKGTFLSGASANQEIGVRLTIAPTPNLTYLLAEHTIVTNVKSADLEVNLIINETPELRWVRLGDTLNLRITLLNRSENPIEKVRVTIPVRHPLIDTEHVRLQNGVLGNNILTFPEKNTLTLLSNTPQEFTATLPLLNTFSTQSTPPIIELTAEVARETSTLRTPAIKLIVVSNMSVKTEARYFGADGAPQGTGPLPPKVGEATQFNVRLRVTNSFHDLSNIAVITTLSEGVAWQGNIRTQNGKVTFNEKTKEVRFEIARMPVTTPEVSAEFTVAATPQESDRGGLLALTGVTRVEATDTIAQVTFSSDAPSLSSALEADPFGRGKGVVQ